MVAEVMKRYGRLDVLVFERRHRHFRAVDHRDVAGGLAAADRDQSRRRVSVGEALPADAMRKTGGGSVIMMSSLAGLRGAAGLSGYCATKGGVRLFCESDRDGVRHVRRRHPRQTRCIPASFRHADLGQDASRHSTGSGDCPDRTRRSISGGSGRKWRRRWARAGHGRGDRAGRAVSGVGSPFRFTR